MTTLLTWISHRQVLTPMLSHLQRRLRILMCHLQAEELSLTAQGASCTSFIYFHPKSVLSMGLEPCRLQVD